MYKWLSQYNINDLVYLKTDVDGSRRQIIAIQFNGGLVSYELAFGTVATWHSESEIIENPEYNEGGFNESD